MPSVGTSCQRPSTKSATTLKTPCHTGVSETKRQHLAKQTPTSMHVFFGLHFGPVLLGLSATSVVRMVRKPASPALNTPNGRDRSAANITGLNLSKSMDCTSCSQTDSFLLLRSPKTLWPRGHLILNWHPNRFPTNTQSLTRLSLLTLNPKALKP